MLKRIRIRNFQCHRKLQIKFDTITTIVGGSDRGKSSVIRALRWCLLNQPGGTSFVRHGSKDTSVEVLFGDIPVMRYRGKNGNGYTAPGFDFKAIGTSVPEELEMMFDVHPDITFQQQHDPPFWLSDNAGAVAKQLNAIVDLDVIDKVIGRANKLVRDIEADHRATTDRLSRAEEDLAGLVWVPEFVEGVEQLETLWNQCQTTASQRSSLTKCISRVKEHGDTLESLSATKIGAQNLRKQLQTLEKTRDGVQTTRKQVQRLKSLSNTLKDREEWLSKKRKQRAELQKLLSKYEACPTCGTVVESS